MKEREILLIVYGYYSASLKVNETEANSLLVQFASFCIKSSYILEVSMDYSCTFTFLLLFGLSSVI